MTSMEKEKEKILKEGWLRKRAERNSQWVDRYFSLRGSSLQYFLKSTDIDPKGIFVLQGACKVSEIGSDLYKKKKQFVFKITWPASEDDSAQDDSDSLNGKALGAKKKSSGVGSSSAAVSGRRKLGSEVTEDRSEAVDSSGTGTRVAALAVGGVVVGALTSGIGLIAGMLVVGLGAAAGGGAVALSQVPPEKEKLIFLACDTYQEAEAWTSLISSKIKELGSSTSFVSLSYQRNAGSRGASVAKHIPPPGVRLEEVEKWVKSSKWRVYSIQQGIRIFEQTEEDGSPISGHGGRGIGGVLAGVNSLLFSVSNLQGPPPCLKVNLAMAGSATEIFMSVMNLPPACRTGMIKTIRTVETIDNYTDIIHLVLEPLFLSPTWTVPRDLCLMRYWKHNSDGSYVICLDSVIHEECPLVPGHVRADLHGVYMIIPPKEGEIDEDHMECMATFIAQMDTRGWIWRYFGYQQAFLQSFVMHMVDIRDALDAERFVMVHFDAAEERRVTSASAEESEGAPQGGTMATIPPPTLMASMWGEADAANFKIRGKTYNTDKMKATSAPSLFKLIAIDLYEVPENTPNIASHPRNRVFQALQRGEDTWVFVMNIMVPGPPYLSFVVYFQGDRTLIEADTPFGRIARPFFFGSDDDFRNNRFKLIPRVVDGNMIIKMAVKDTPTLLGNKLKQYYFKGDNYFELDVDVGSSSVARNVVGLAIGYSKSIVVDMGLCLQGNEENELPEVLFGGCTCIHVDCSTAKKL